MKCVGDSLCKNTHTHFLGHHISKIVLKVFSNTTNHRNAYYTKQSQSYSSEKNIRRSFQFLYFSYIIISKSAEYLWIKQWENLIDSTKYQYQ